MPHVKPVHTTMEPLSHTPPRLTSVGAGPKPIDIPSSHPGRRLLSPSPFGRDDRLEATFHDDRMKQYVDWQIQHYQSPRLREYFEKAYEVALAQGVCLKQISQEKDVRFFIEKGIIPGVAWSFVHDLDDWIAEHDHPVATRPPTQTFPTVVEEDFLKNV